MNSNQDLHGNAPDKSETALLMIDVVNDLEFPEGDQMLPFALHMARQLAALRQRVDAAGLPVIYVNDNFGRWRSDFNRQVEHCLHDRVRGQSVVELLLPKENDYFVLKPKHSGFYATSLDILLKYLGARKLIITGLAGNNCVLFTASDAYLRDYELIIPADCVASNTAADNDAALAQMQRMLKADIRPSGELEVGGVKEGGGGRE